MPLGGTVVNGEYVPEGAAVSIPIYAASRSARNWSHPDCFIPERWVGEDSQFSSDKREASQPFSFGPRNCIGRNLAYVEIKIIIARLIWHFDIENATEGDWLDQKVYMIWEKAPFVDQTTRCTKGLESDRLATKVLGNRLVSNVQRISWM